MKAPIFDRLCICAGIVLLAAGCASAPPPGETVQGPVGWGESVNGLQVGIAPLTVQYAPNRPQAGTGELTGVRVYLRNFGQDALTLIDPGPFDAPRSTHPAIWTIYTEPDHSAQIDEARPDPARVVTLAPGEMTSFSVSLPMLPKGQGPHRLVAEYANADSVVNIQPAGSTAPAKAVSGIWTGQARSDVLFVNETP